MLSAGLLSGRADGQSADAPGAAAAPIINAPPAAAGALGTAGPDVFLLPDESGQLRRVLGYRYEDFLNAWQADGPQAGPRQPKHVLRGLTMNATAAGEAAKVEIEINVELQSAAWTEVPLQLGALIVDDARITGEGPQEFVTFDAARGEYVAWLKGKPGDKRTVVIGGQAVLDRDGGGRRLQLDLPPAANSVINLTAAGGQFDVQSPDHALTTVHPAAEGASTLRMEGAKGRLDVRWGPPDSQDAQHATALEATVETLIDVEPGRLSYEATIALDSFGSPLDRVRVRLPKGTMSASAQEAVGYDVTPVSLGSSAASGSDSPSVVEIRFHESAIKPPVVRLVAEPDQSAGDRGSVLEANGFEVIGAVRQRGVVALAVSDRLHAHYDHEGWIEQIEAAELPEAMRMEATTAAFMATGAAWRLDVHTQPRERQIRVTPRYELHLGVTGAMMDVILDFQISGGRTFELQVDLARWELSEQPIESGGDVDLTDQHVTPDQILVMPLKDSDVEQVRVRFSLRREAGLGAHLLPLPEALDAITLPGALDVTCDEAWRAVPDLKNSPGIAALEAAIDDSAESVPANGASAHAASALRLQTLMGKARLAIDVAERDQVIEARSIVSARFEPREVEVKQRLQYDVLYQAAERLTATVDTELVANERLELLLDGKPLPPTAIDVLQIAPSAVASADAKLRLVVQLPRPTLGRVELQIGSVHPLTVAERGGAAAVNLPLAVPDQPADSVATISASSETFRVELLEPGEAEVWTLDFESTAASGSAEPPALRLIAAGAVDELPLRLHPSGSPDLGDVRVEAAWAQTWIAGGMRQDRVVYRFDSASSRVRLLLPRSFGSEPVEVLVNGRVVAADSSQPGKLAVALPQIRQRESYTLELRRHTPIALGSWDELHVAFPRIEADRAEAPIFWQLVLPGDLAAVTTPQGLSGEYRLGWQGFRWGRQPTQTQADLERWTGAEMAPAPSPATSQYIFSAFEPPSEVRITVVRRTWFVIAGGLAALGAGLAWLHTSVGRSAAFWLLVCVGSAGALLVYPAGALVMGQAALVGGVLTLLAAALKSLWPAPSERPTTAMAASSSIGGHTATTQPWIAEPRGSSVASASAPSYHASGSGP